MFLQRPFFKNKRLLLSDIGNVSSSTQISIMKLEARVKTMLMSQKISFLCKKLTLQITLSKVNYKDFSFYFTRACRQTVNAKISVTQSRTKVLRRYDFIEPWGLILAPNSTMEKCHIQHFVYQPPGINHNTYLIGQVFRLLLIKKN